MSFLFKGNKNNAIASSNITLSNDVIRKIAFDFLCKKAQKMNIWPHPKKRKELAEKSNFSGKKINKKH